MTEHAILIGSDPGLSHFGCSAVRLYRDHEEVLLLDVFASKKSDRKRHVLSADDNCRRGAELVGWLHRHLEQLRFKQGPVRGWCAESMSFPRNSSAAGKMSISWGVIISLQTLAAMPLVQASPQEIKLALCGRKDASKEDVRDKLIERYKSQPRIEQMLSHVPAGQRDHAWDSLGAIVASLNSDVVKALRSA